MINSLLTKVIGSKNERMLTQHQQRADQFTGHRQPAGPEIGGIHGGREIENDDQRGSGGTKLDWRNPLPDRSRQCQNGE